MIGQWGHQNGGEREKGMIGGRCRQLGRHLRWGVAVEGGFGMRERGVGRLLEVERHHLRRIIGGMVIWIGDGMIEGAWVVIRIR